jgi:hypothetical protein
MGILPDMFVDPALRTRQDLLNGQWISISASIKRCDNFPTTEWISFSNDFRNWTTFYDSESDYTSSSKHATDDWQTKLQYWSGELSRWCSANINSDGNAVDSSNPDYVYVPGVKDPPPDPQGSGILDELKKDVAAPFQWAEGLVLKIGIGVAVLVVIVIIGIIYALSKSNLKASARGVEVSHA